MQLGLCLCIACACDDDHDDDDDDDDDATVSVLRWCCHHAALPIAPGVSDVHVLLCFVVVTLCSVLQLAMPHAALPGCPSLPSIPGGQWTMHVVALYPHHLLVLHIYTHACVQRHMLEYGGSYSKCG